MELSFSSPTIRMGRSARPPIAPVDVTSDWYRAMAYPNCTTCEERGRKLLDALIQAKMGEAVKQATLGAAELLGLKEKPNE